MSYRCVDGDPDLDSIRLITAVLFSSDGYCMAQPDDPSLSSGRVLPNEHPLLDACLRIPLLTHGFRMQRVHSVAVEDEPDGLRWFCFMEGSPYGGRRPHNSVELRKFTPEELADALQGNASAASARVVRDAAKAYRRQGDGSVLADSRRLLEPAYLRAETPHGQSGVGGSAADWRRSREPVVDGLDRDGDFLDIGCANGHLMESVRQWAGERGIGIEPYGMDIGPRLIELARHRLPQWADRLWVGNAADWTAPDGRRFDFVHTRLDVVPVGRRPALSRHITENLLRPDGRLIVTHHDAGANEDAARALTRLGYLLAGRSGSVAWTDRRDDGPRGQETRASS